MKPSQIIDLVSEAAERLQQSYIHIRSRAELGERLAQGRRLGNDIEARAGQLPLDPRTERGAADQQN
jgi:hypothetical protein